MNEQRNNFDRPLSEAGQMRRREILRLAQAEGRHRRSRRRATIAAAVVVVMVLSVTTVQRRGEHVAPGQLAVKIESPEKSTSAAPIDTSTVTFIESDAHIVQRLAVAPQEPSWQKLNDDELLTRLAEIGQPGALTIVDGKPTLVLVNPPQTPDGL